MPTHKVGNCYQWGKHGKVYPTKAQADKQGRAIYANGWKNKVNEEKNIIDMKRTIRLTESDLKQVIKESVKNVLKEAKPSDRTVGKHTLKGLRYDKNGNPLYTSDTMSDDEKKNQGWRFSKKHGLYGQLSDPTKLTESDLRKVVKESVNKILKEWTSPQFEMDIDGKYQVPSKYGMYNVIINGCKNGRPVIDIQQNRRDGSRSNTTIEPDTYYHTLFIERFNKYYQQTQDVQETLNMVIPSL